VAVAFDCARGMQDGEQRHLQLEHHSEHFIEVFSAGIQPTLPLLALRVDITPVVVRNTAALLALC